MSRSRWPFAKLKSQDEFRQEFKIKQFGAGGKPEESTSLGRSSSINLRRLKSPSSSLRQPVQAPWNTSIGRIPTLALLSLVTLLMGNSLAYIVVDAITIRLLPCSFQVQKLVDPRPQLQQLRDRHWRRLCRRQRRRQQQRQQQEV